jgi:hypothetical protein
VFSVVLVLAVRANLAAGFDFWALILEISVVGVFSVLVVVSRFGKGATTSPLNLVMLIVAATLIASVLVWISGGVRPAY